MASAWISFVKKQMKKHKGKSLKEVLKLASKEWKKRPVKGTIIKKGPHKGEQRYTTKRGDVRKTARKAYMK